MSHLELSFVCLCRRRTPWLGATIVALMVNGVVAAQPAEEPPAPVVVAPAEERLLAPVTFFSGTVISRDDAKLAAEVEGRLKWVADVGTSVKRGQSVARLDDVLIREALAENEATVVREQARLTFYTQEVERLQPLLERKIVTPSSLDQAISNHRVAESELAVARARVMQADEQLERTNLRAPFDGVVTERFVQAGEWATRGTAIVRLVDAQSLEVQTRVPAETLAFINKGSDLKLTASPRQSTGTVRAIVPVGDDRSRLYELRLTLKGQRWPAGQAVRVEVPTAPARKVVAVPRDALVIRRDGTSIFRVNDDDTAERVNVDTGVAAGPLIEVNNGVRAGDRVVIRGGERLRPGQKVVVVPGSQP
jgi:RND family efflux transporter MFP subunit